MSRVHFQFRQPDPDDPSGLEVVDAEVVEITPLRRRIDGRVVVLPRTVPVLLEQGEAIVELAATGPSECWQAVEPDTGKTRHFTIPDTTAVLEYTELPDVDPTTLEPSAEPEAAWWAAIETMAGGWPLPASTALRVSRPCSRRTGTRGDTLPRCRVAHSHLEVSRSVDT